MFFPVDLSSLLYFQWILGVEVSSEVLVVSVSAAELEIYFNNNQISMGFRIVELHCILILTETQ